MGKQREEDRFVAETAKIVLLGVIAMFFLLFNGGMLGVGVVTFCAVFEGIIS